MARKNILQPHVFYRNFMGVYLYFVITIQEKNLELFHHWMKFMVGKSRIMVFVVVVFMLRICERWQATYKFKQNIEEIILTSHGIGSS